MKTSLNLRVLSSLLLLTAVCGVTVAQTYDTLKVCTYNVLNYPPSDTSKNAHYRMIMRAVDPDILVVQEMNSSAGATAFLNNVMNAGRPGTYSTATYSTDSSDNAVYYKSSQVSLVGSVQIVHTEPRHWNGFRLRPVGIAADSIDIQIYSGHLKASEGSENEQRRAVSAESLRTRFTELSDGGFFIAAGDFNLYDSSEEAWANFTESRADNSGRLYDPINRVGNWHDASSYADVHTQSTRTETLSDGGSTGGLDDRFDFLLLGYTFQNAGGWDYITGSYTEYGNDGNHLNQSINNGTNSAVPDSIADALWAASDHLPVYLLLRRQVTPPASITLSAPNGSELYYVGSSYNITWTSQSLTGNVSLSLNRNFPTGGWETIVSGTANDGLYAWTATAPVTTSARIRVISDSQPMVRDSSDGNFEIRNPSITLTSPDGGESWTIGTNREIIWTSTAIVGNVMIELNRDFPPGIWETLFANTANDGVESWAVSVPATSHARIRISSVNTPAARDSSHTDFSIVHSDVPIVRHDPHADSSPGWTTFTVYVTDDFPNTLSMLIYRPAGGSFDSTELVSTGNPDEYADSLFFTFGKYEYFIRAYDSELQTTTTDTFEFVVSLTAQTSIGYDDGSAELYNWAEHDSLEWAVKFTPPRTPFVLSDISFGVAGFHPDTAHTSVIIKIYDAGGTGEMPGTLLREIVRGSAGNVIGGLPTPGLYTVFVHLSDDLTEPLTVNGNFYVSVQNIEYGKEAFAMDTLSPNAGRSFYFDPCEPGWFAENGALENSRDGNRMIRAYGWAETPSELVITSSGTNIVLRWKSSGAPYYRVYRQLNWDDPLSFIASTSDTTITLTNAVSAAVKTYYSVVSSSHP